MDKKLQKYYQLYEISEAEAENFAKANYDHINAYKKDDKFYTLSWGTTISTLANDGKTILFNTEIEGVIAANNDDEAAEKFGLTLIKEQPELQ